jgi:hypothetical protein
MPVTFDAVTQHDGINTAGSSFTHTPVGTPTAVVVAATQNADRSMSVTYGGASMTLIGKITSPNSTTQQLLFGLANPASGAQTVALTFVGNQQTDTACMTFLGTALTFAGAFGVAVTNAANSGNASATLSISSGNMGVSVVGNNQDVSASAVAWSGVSPGTERYNHVDSGPNQDIAGQTFTTAGSNSIAWTNNNTVQTSWALVAVEVMVPGAASTGTPLLSILGVWI